MPSIHAHIEAQYLSAMPGMLDEPGLMEVIKDRTPEQKDNFVYDRFMSGCRHAFHYLKDGYAYDEWMEKARTINGMEPAFAQTAYDTAMYVLKVNRTNRDKNAALISIDPEIAFPLSHEREEAQISLYIQEEMGFNAHYVYKKGEVWLDGGPYHELRWLDKEKEVFWKAFGEQLAKTVYEYGVDKEDDVINYISIRNKEKNFSVSRHVRPNKEEEYNVSSSDARGNIAIVHSIGIETNGNGIITPTINLNHRYWPKQIKKEDIHLAVYLLRNKYKELTDQSKAKSQTTDHEDDHYGPQFKYNNETNKYDPIPGYHKNLYGAVFMDKDIATGEVIVEDNKVYYRAIDKQGNEYETQETPCIKINDKRLSEAEMVFADTTYGVAYSWKCEQFGITALGDTKVEAQIKWMKACIAENVPIIQTIDRKGIDPKALANRYVNISTDQEKHTLNAIITDLPKTPARAEKHAAILAYLDDNKAEILDVFSKLHSQNYKELSQYKETARMDQTDKYTTLNIIDYNQDLIQGAKFEVKTPVKLTGQETHDYMTFIETIQHSFPQADINALNELCSIADKMSKYTAMKSNGKYSEEYFNKKTNKLSDKVEQIVSSIPGLKYAINCEPNNAGIKLELPIGHFTSPENCIFNVPQVSENKFVKVNDKGR